MKDRPKDLDRRKRFPSEDVEQEGNGKASPHQQGTMITLRLISRIIQNDKTLNSSANQEQDLGAEEDPRDQLSSVSSCLYLCSVYMSYGEPPYSPLVLALSDSDVRSRTYLATNYKTRGSLSWERTDLSICIAPQQPEYCFPRHYFSPNRKSQKQKNWRKERKIRTWKPVHPAKQQPRESLRPQVQAPR